ncbi:MAG: MBOAT family protein [Lachnospiraceae bacterium]|nr:MBOAT family protein [Lachnospiraceae bacterium]
MLFNSYDFIFLFFPITLLGFFILQRAGRRLWNDTRRISLENAFLLAASFVFYGWLHPEYIPVLISSMAVNYGLFVQMEKTQHKKKMLAAGLVFNIGALALFKYVGTGDFLPLGISFFTFTQIAFLMESYRGNLKEVSALSYGLYVSFFPKIIQGPIALPGEMLPQFEKAEKRVDWERIYRCLYLFVLGLFKKVLLADTLGRAADFGYANLPSLNSVDGIIVMLSYTLQLYFDFSGYCDMAMGIAGMLGIDLPLNFDSPYKASNIMEFWKRWHITLTRFFTRYLYIPLGGNRKGRARTYLNCLIIFLVSGIWHGAGWQFIIWGLLHGVLYVFTRAWMDWRAGKGEKRQGKSRVLHDISVFLTFLYVNIAWVFFRAPSVGDALGLLRTICSFRFGRVNWDLASCFNLDEFWYVIKVAGIDSWQYAHYILMAVIIAAMLALVFLGKNSVEAAKKVKPGVANTIFMAVLFVWSVLSFTGVSSFLYVNF